MTITSSLSNAQLSGKYVFLRADLNVPLKDATILCDFRLNALKPTLDLLLEKQARVVLGTHIGRPEGVDQSLSTKVLMSWFITHGYSITWVATLEEAFVQHHTLEPQSIMLLENLRFFEGERSHDEGMRKQFACDLSNLAEYYVNDAFALLHRHDTSITLLPELYKTANKTVGLLIEKEMKTLGGYFYHPRRPFLLILGGGKVKDKLPFLEKLLDVVDALIILPALVFTFLKAQGKNVGLSFVDKDFLEQARLILAHAEKKGVRIIFPVDYLVCLDTFSGPLQVVNEAAIPLNAIGLAVGPQTLELYKKELQEVKMVFVNGAMGLHERPETLQPLYHLLTDLAESKVCSIIGGGDSVSAVYDMHLEHKITYCSTGGGASLYLLTYGTLPALRFVID